MPAISPVLKYCSGCDQDLPTGEFYRRKRAHDGLQSQCKTCQLVRNKKWAETPEGRVSRAASAAKPKARAARKRWAEGKGRAVVKGIQRRHLAKLRKEQREVVAVAKDVPCADCGQRFHPVAMDFDHVRGEKQNNVASMVGRTYSLEALQEEIAKCEVVCANCHRVRSFVKEDSDAS